MISSVFENLLLLRKSILRATGFVRPDRSDRPVGSSTKSYVHLVWISNLPMLKQCNPFWTVHWRRRNAVVWYMKASVSQKRSWILAHVSTSLVTCGLEVDFRHQCCWLSNEAYSDHGWIKRHVAKTRSSLDSSNIEVDFGAPTFGVYIPRGQFPEHGVFNER